MVTAFVIFLELAYLLSGGTLLSFQNPSIS